jgi:hypothetical protein
VSRAYRPADFEAFLRKHSDTVPSRQSDDRTASNRMAAPAKAGLSIARVETALRPTETTPTVSALRTATGLKWSGRMDLNHRPPGPEESGTKHLSAASGVAYGTLRPFTLPLNWTEVGRNSWPRTLDQRPTLAHYAPLLPSVEGALRRCFWASAVCTTHTHAGSS